MNSQRLDLALVSRGLATTRTKAKRLIEGGAVAVNGVVSTKASVMVGEADSVAVSAADQDVGRGAKKLRAALDLWTIPIAGASCVDLGASTGGFSQVLLERGATRVIAIDVGHSQLDPLLANDSRLHNVEGVNVTSLSSGWWSERALPQPSVVVADLSFISLTAAVPVIVPLFGVHSHYVVLVKPQFEVGRGGLDGGIVKDDRRRIAALTRVAQSFRDNGVPVRAVAPSPMTGEKGNVEYLLYASATTSVHPPEWDGSSLTPTQ